MHLSLTPIVSPIVVTYHPYIQWGQIQMLSVSINYPTGLCTFESDPFRTPFKDS